MKNQNTIVALNISQNDENYSEFNAGDVIDNRFKVLQSVVEETGEYSYVCEDSNEGKIVFITFIPLKITSNQDKYDSLQQYLRKLIKLNGKNLESNYEIIKASEGQYHNYIKLAKPTGVTIDNWVKVNDLKDEQKREQLLSMLGSVANALDRLHSNGLLQGELSSKNIIVDNEDAATLVNKSIYSYIYYLSNGETFNPTSKNNIDCHAPELWNGEQPSPKTEQYAFGAIVYELFSHAKPFADVRPAFMKRAVLEQAPDLPLNTTQRESKAIMRALSKNPDERFASCSKFIRALKPLNVNFQ